MKAITKNLIKWKNSPIEDATWKNEEFVQKHLQLTHIEDNTSLKRSGCWKYYHRCQRGALTR